MALRIHLFSFRTQKLSSTALKVLGGQPPGRISCCHIIFLYSSAVGRPCRFNTEKGATKVQVLNEDTRVPTTLEKRQNIPL